MYDTPDGLPDDPKQADIDAALAHVADGITRLHEPGESERPPCPPAVELYDQDRRIFAGHTSEPGRTLLDVDADSPEGQALVDELNGDLSIAEPDLPWAPPGYALDDAAKLLAQAVATGMADVRVAGSDGSGRTIWRVTGLGPNIVHFGQAHVREALERRWLVVGNGGKLQASPLLDDEAGS